MQSTTRTRFASVSLPSCSVWSHWSNISTMGAPMQMTRRTATNNCRTRQRTNLIIAPSGCRCSSVRVLRVPRATRRHHVPQPGRARPATPRPGQDTRQGRESLRRVLYPTRAVQARKPRGTGFCQRLARSSSHAAQRSRGFGFPPDAERPLPGTRWRNRVVLRVANLPTWIDTS